MWYFVCVYAACGSIFFIRITEIYSWALTYMLARGCRKQAFDYPICIATDTLHAYKYCSFLHSTQQGDGIADERNFDRTGGGWHARHGRLRAVRNSQLLEKERLFRPRTVHIWYAKKWPALEEHSRSWLLSDLLSFPHIGWAVYALFHAHLSVVCHTISTWLTVLLAVWRYIAVRWALDCVDYRLEPLQQHHTNASLAQTTWTWNISKRTQCIYNDSSRHARQLSQNETHTKRT